METNEAMQRSFDDRVLGGVCAGLAASLHVNAWLVRIMFVVLAFASLGAVLAAYLMLWWLVPQQSSVLPRRRLPLAFALLILLAAIVLWALNLTGQLISSDGVSLYLPILLVVLTGVFFLRQWGGRTA
jgi:phage shock protein PspC (stress-responsive transcriptional regulator)